MRTRHANWLVYRQTIKSWSTAAAVSTGRLLALLVRVLLVHRWWHLLLLLLLYWRACHISRLRMLMRMLAVWTEAGSAIMRSEIIWRAYTARVMHLVPCNNIIEITAGGIEGAGEVLSKLCLLASCLMILILLSVETKSLTVCLVLVLRLPLREWYKPRLHIITTRIELLNRLLHLGRTRTIITLRKHGLFRLLNLILRSLWLDEAR